MGCHSSVIHYRMLEAFDALGTTQTQAIIPHILKSVPIDTDRALLHETDSYENLVARVVARSGLGRQIDVVTHIHQAVDNELREIEDIGIRQHSGEEVRGY